MTFADIVINQNYSKSKANITPDDVNRRVASLIRDTSTRRFVLSEDAATRVGEAIRLYPELLVENGWFARTPFERCWIELPSRSLHSAIMPDYHTDQADDRVGYLFDGESVYVCASSGNDSAGISPLVYRLHEANDAGEDRGIMEYLSLSEGAMDRFYWGATMAKSLDPDIRSGLRAQHGFSLAVREKYAEALRGRGEDWLLFSAGEVRNIIGILLMLNQPSLIERVDVPRSSKMTRRGRIVTVAHTVIDLKFTRTPKTIFASHGSRPRGSSRWHTVRDHWCHNRVAREATDHTHQWEVQEGKLSATCSVCGGRRWRRQMRNGRGDKSLGTIIQTRIVK